ncbi:MAG: DUF1822 family protein [Aphanothece sp. CMT-3BRIN-NPC111]|jgi:hypothetical protein|nr:DUF1822 family protein [Aphanothece sp. CMT-3BRIN-NPC111]
MNSTQTQSVTVPLRKEAHYWARAFAAEQATPHKGKRVYLNTLAVYAVHTYLKWLQIDTDLDDGDSWHPGVRPLFDVADLVIPSVGKLECRPVLPGETSFTLPAEVLEDRIGYLAVQFKETLNEVDLLGFVPTFDPSDPPDEVETDELLPIEDLIDHLSLIREEIEFLESDDEVAYAVRELLETRSIADCAAQLDWIWRNVSENKQLFAVKDFLVDSGTEGEVVLKSRDILASSREERLTTEQAEDSLQQLAENLLLKLKQIWGDR